MKKKSRGGGQNPLFLPKNTNFFQKLIFFLEKSVHQGGGSCPPLPPLGYALGKNNKLKKKVTYKNESD